MKKFKLGLLRFCVLLPILALLSSTLPAQESIDADLTDVNVGMPCYCIIGKEMVGTVRFELTTYRPPV